MLQQEVTKEFSEKQNSIQKDASANDQEPNSLEFSEEMVDNILEAVNAVADTMTICTGTQRSTHKIDLSSKFN